MLNVVYWVRGEEYADMAGASARSVLRCYRAKGRAKVSIYCYTDSFDYRVFDTPVFDEVISVPHYNDSAAMLANLQMQVHFCLSRFFTAPTLFLDADVLAIAPIAGIQTKKWWKGHDLVVTQRDHAGHDEAGNKVVGVARDMPYNYGVMGVNNTLNGIECMLWLRDRVMRMGLSRQIWYGNQWALRELVRGSHTDPTPREVDIRLPHCGANVQVLDCEEYNYTPELYLKDSIDTKFFVHPKGDRRDIFWNLVKEYA
jgi:hypothetical protein